MDYQLGPGPLQVDQNAIDEKIKSDIGIVENGDVATHAIAKGYYVIWKGDLYIAKTDISSGTTLSAASNGNLTAKPSGLGAEVAALNSKLTPQTMTVSYSESVFETHNVSATKHGRLLHISGYFANSSNTNAGIVAVVNSCYPVGTLGSVALPVQCDDNSVRFLSFESANNNLTIKTPTTLTANKYVRFNGFIECSQ